MKLDPYKFSLIVTKEQLDLNRTWKAFTKEESLDPHARFGAYKQGDGSWTFRMEIDHEYFRPDDKHWKRSSIRAKIKELFKNFQSTIPIGTILVLGWTTDSSWLGIKWVKERMEVWDGRSEEPKSLWTVVQSIGKWED